MDALKKLSNDFKLLISKPENYLSVQDGKAENAKTILKHLYDFLKSDEDNYSWKPENALPELIVGNFDEEQIWQLIELQNGGLFNKIVQDVATVLAKKSRLTFETGPTLETEGDDDEAESIEEEEDEENDSEMGETDEEEEKEPKLKFQSELDDDFFKLSEMETFCDEIEKEEKNLGVNLFLNEDETEPELIRYNDFFGKPKNVEKLGKTKKVQFLEDVEENFSGDEEMDENDEELKEEDDGIKSSFQERQERLKARIESLEDEAMKEKPWHLKGEITSAGRPQNSLLEEYVEFDRAARPAPVFTEKTTLRLEDIIKQRIKDQSWDDVVRKVKPAEDVREFRKRLVLDQEKSKISLAEIYEQEFIKQRDAANSVSNELKEDVEPPEHIEIKKLMKKLFNKLDALSNFHYTPKQVVPEVKIISNLPAITMEDVAPVTTSDGALLAPEEIKNKPKGELMSKEERNLTDKKRERRNKKLKQRIREKEKEKKEKMLKKLSLGLGNKYSKEKAEKTIDKLTKEKNVDRMIESHAKPIRSSSAFFNKLEDQVKGQIKSGNSAEKKRKKIMDQITAKKIKL